MEMESAVQTYHQICTRCARYRITLEQDVSGAAGSLQCAYQDTPDGYMRQKLRVMSRRTTLPY